MLKGPGEGRCPGKGRFWDAPVGALQLPWSASYLLLPGLDSRYRDSRSFSCCRLPRSCRPAGRLTCHGATKFASTTQAELAPTPGIAELVPTPTPLRCFPSSPRLCGISRTHVHTLHWQNSRPHRRRRDCTSAEPNAASQAATSQLHPGASTCLPQHRRCDARSIALCHRGETDLQLQLPGCASVSSFGPPRGSRRRRFRRGAPQGLYCLYVLSYRMGGPSGIWPH